MKPSTISRQVTAMVLLDTARALAGVLPKPLSKEATKKHPNTEHWILRVLEAMLIIFASQLQSAIGSCQMCVFFRSFWWEKPSPVRWFGSARAWPIGGFCDWHVYTLSIWGLEPSTLQGQTDFRWAPCFNLMICFVHELHEHHEHPTKACQIEVGDEGGPPQCTWLPYYPCYPPSTSQPGCKAR